MTRQMRDRSPAPVIPHRGRVFQLHDPRHGRETASPSPRATVAELHVVVLGPTAAAAAASRHGRIIRVWTRDLFPTGGGGGGSEFAAARVVVVVVIGELAGDFGREMAEEVGDGDKAGADDAGGDFGDAV